MTNLNFLVLGATTTFSLLAAVFFAKFWNRTGDRLFLMFSLAFSLEAVSRILLACRGAAGDSEPLIYLIRLAGYLMIFLAFIGKNR